MTVEGVVLGIAEEKEVKGMTVEEEIAGMAVVIMLELIRCWKPEAVGAGSCIWADSMLLLCCMLKVGTWDPLRKLKFVITIFGSESSNKKAGLFGQLTYSTSIFAVSNLYYFTIWVCLFELTLIKLPTFKIFGVKDGQIWNFSNNYQMCAQ